MSAPSVGHANTPALDRLVAALDTTWPAAATKEQHGCLLRDGAGGGKRVSAATPRAPDADLEAAASEMRARGQRPLFRLTPEHASFDTALAAQGYRLVDPTLLYLAPVGLLAQKPPPVRLFDIWPPLAIMREIWAAGGIGPERLAVMARAPAPRTGLIARIDDRAAGVGFLAIDADVAMLHAMEVAPQARRKGVAGVMLRGAADWAQARGARWLTLAVTEANSGARALYTRLGMRVAGRYHYREGD